jgi:hypothetical protein
VVYRSAFGEPLLVAAMLSRSARASFWRWSAAAHDFQRTYQVASGAHLSLFILGHMNSGSVYARSLLGMPTDWNLVDGLHSNLPASDFGHASLKL